MLKLRGFLCPVRIIPEVGSVGCHGVYQASMDQNPLVPFQVLTQHSSTSEGKGG